jgi:hypothetical protein
MKDDLMRTSIIFLICCTGIIAACKSKEKMKRDISAVQITIGQGGGFTGFYTDYIIYGTGKVERYTTRDNKTAEVKPVPVDSVKAWVARMDEIHFNNIELDQPGNMSFYLQLQEPKSSHKVKWGNATPPADLSNLYDRINKAVSE